MKNCPDDIINTITTTKVYYNNETNLTSFSSPYSSDDSQCNPLSEGTTITSKVLSPDLQMSSSMSFEDDLDIILKSNCLSDEEMREEIIEIEKLLTESENNTEVMT